MSGTALWDLAFGGINDDAFSQMLLPDLIASASRVYGAFLLAAALALPLGMLIGRLRLVKELLEPTLQVLRPVPVTAWLPLSMIMFGIGPKSAFFLVALGAFYPILVNTMFAVRSVEPRLFEAAQMLGVSPARLFPESGAAGLACRGSSPGLRLGPGIRLGGDRRRRNDRRADRAGRDDHGCAAVVAHRDRHLPAWR